MVCRTHKYSNGGQVKSYADGGRVNSGGSEASAAAHAKVREATKQPPLRKPKRGKKPKRIGS